MTDPMTHEVQVYFDLGTLTFQASLTYYGESEESEDYESALENYYKEIFKAAYPGADHVSILKLENLS